MIMICNVPDEVVKSVKMGTWCGSSVAEKMIANGIPLDKIRAEIQNGIHHFLDGEPIIEIKEVLQIFDKYKPGSEEQEPKTGHWIKISPANIYECSECGQNVMTQDICAYKFCHGCGAKMVELQESEDKE